MATILTDDKGENMSKIKGAFIDSLVRNNKQIKLDRAEAIGEDAGIRFKRVVEDIEIEIRRKKRERDNMLDLSPENSLFRLINLPLKVEFIG